MYSVTVHGVRPSIIPQIFGTPPSSIFRQCLITDQICEQLQLFRGKYIITEQNTG
jgi:hypothetical protein